MKVAGGTAGIETVHLLIQKSCLCPIALCNYKYISMLEFFPIVVHFFNILSRMKMNLFRLTVV